MIASNIICRGASRFLNKAYFQDVQIGGTATLSSLSLSGTLTVNGATTINNALNVTGTSTINKIIASNFIVNNGIELYHNTPFIDFHFGNSTTDYTSRIIESSSGTLHIAQNLTIASTISAPTGVISTLNSTNVNVTNNLRANHYDLQTVAQLGGSFYVSPTVKFPNSGTTLAVAKSGTTLTLTITDSSITSTTMAGIVWSANSRVKVSGTINGVVTGTMDGTISSINTGSHTLTLSVSGENSGSVQASPSGSPYTASQFSDLSVMVYQRRDGSNDYRVGIWMNCYDIANSSSTIRIYGGSDTNPNVMLGNLTSAGLGTVNNLTPTGWGLFAQNAFLHGKVVANGGLIGNWTIGTTGMFYNSDAPGSTSITMIPGGTTASTTSIGGSSGSKSWIFTGKNLFGIDTTGKLYASSAEISGKITATSGSIGGWSIWTNSFGKTTDTSRVLVQAMDSPTSGNWAIRVDTKNSTDTDWTNRIHLSYGGEFFANNADISGKISASSGTIGGFHITSSSNQGTSSAGGHIYTNSLYRHSGDGTTYEYEFGMKGDAAENPSSSNTTYGNLAFYVKRINKGAAWNGTNTNMFYVTHKGFMYCKEAEIAGKITATSGAIAGWRIESTYLASGTATAPAANTLLLSPAGTSSSYTVAGTAKSGWMITAGTTFGVNKDGGVYATSGAIGPWNVTTTSIYKAANTLGSTTSGAAYFGDLGLSIGNKFKVDASGDGAIILGELAEGKTHVEVDSDSFDVCVGANTGSNASKIASFGENVVLGNENESQFVISSNSIRGVVGNSIDAFRFSISDAEMSSTRHWSKEVSDKDGNRNIQLNIVGLSTGAKIHFQLNATKNKQRDGTIISYDFTYGTSVDNVPFSMDNGITLQLHYNGSDLIRYNIIFNTNDETVHSLFITFTSYTYGPYFSLGTRDEDGSFGGYSCTIGYNNIAYGAYSCAIGVGTIASKSRQLAIGSYNIEDTDETNHLRFIIGNGSSSLSRSNALTVDWHGNVVASGNIACTGVTAPLFIEKSFQTGNLSVGANAAFSINFNQLSGYSIPNGYRAIAFSHISVNNNYLYFRWMNPV